MRAIAANRIASIPMVRITLKITKPVDSTALPKEPTSRAKRAQHRKGMPKGPALPPAQSAPAAGPASPPAATARPAAVPDRGNKHRGKPSTSAAGRGEPAPTDARRAASTSSDSRRGKPTHSEAPSRRRSTSGGAPPSGTADGTKKDFRSGEKRGYGAQAKPAHGGPPESKYGARRAPSDRTKPGPLDLVASACAQAPRSEGRPRESPASRESRRPAPLEAHGRAGPVFAARGRQVDRERLGEGRRQGRHHARRAGVAAGAHRDRQGGARSTRASR